LRRIRGGDNESNDAAQGRIDALLERNRRVRALFKPDSPAAFERYHVSSRPSVWPRVLALSGPLPTQLYRFVRLGNLEAFASQVEEAAAAPAPAAEVAAPAEAAARRRGKKKRRRTVYSK
jgi:hypothetical protein